MSNNTQYIVATYQGEQLIGKTSPMTMEKAQEEARTMRNGRPITSETIYVVEPAN